MRYQLLLWDFDGTLADTLELSVQLYNGLAAKYGCRPIEDPEAARQMTTLHFLRAYRISPAKLPALRREFLSLQRAQLETVRLFAGLPDLLRMLNQKNIRLGVLSSNSVGNIRICLRANGVEELFRFIVSYPLIFGKVRGLRRILRTEAVEPQQLLYVGDEARDIEAAHQAGVDSVAVAWGFQKPETLAACSPTYQIDYPDQLLRLLERASS